MIISRSVIQWLKIMPVSKKELIKMDDNSECDIKQKMLNDISRLINDIDLKNIKTIDFNIDDRYSGERDITISIEVVRK